MLFSLLELVDAKPLPGSLHQNPVVTLLQDVFVRIAASAASRTTCARSLYEDLLCKMFVSPQQDPEGLLVQNRSRYADLLCKVSLSGCLHQDPVGPLVQDLRMRISCARSLYQDACIRIL